MMMLSKKPISIKRILLFFILLALLPAGQAFGQVSDDGRDTRTWTDPSGSGIAITFSSPDLYYSCTSAFDRIYTEGVPANWRLDGQVRVLWATPTGLELVPGGYYDIDQLGDLDLLLDYPPAWQWPDLNSIGNPLRELHVDLGIAVRDENGKLVTWVGGDPVWAPGILGPGQDWDVFCLPQSTIGDTVWQDNNANRAQEADEPGIPGVTVVLKDAGPDNQCSTADDIFITSQETDSSGNYLFKRLPEGLYCVDPDETTVPPGLILTTNNDPQTVDLGPDEDFLKADFGYTPALLSLGDRVWYDQDQDGIQDPNEPGYNGATVDLYDNATCSGTPAASTTTGATGPDGFYQFTNLPAGGYCLQFGNIPAGWSISPADQGDGTNDSSANGSAQIPGISLTADDPDEDMGIYVPGSLGDSVICESTGDPLANITVSLFEDFDGNGAADGPAVATTSTNASGFYQFSGLEVALAGDPNNLTRYIVQVDANDPDLGSCNVPVPPTEYNPPLDSDNPNDPNNDFSFSEQPATVGDRVWFDNDGDGVQDAGEPGIPGVTVNLTDCSGNILESDVTDANGTYLFDGLAAATYCVVVDQTTLPGSVQQTFEKDGSLDGDTQQPLAPGDDVRDVDFGYQPLGAIGDTVFEDTNNNGLQDPGEPGIPGVVVDLTCAGPDGTFGTADDILASDTTDANGSYLFTNLPAGVCEVNPDETTVPAGYTLTTNNDPQTVDLGPGEIFLDADFGYVPLTASLGDRVWFDTNANGIQDPGEGGIPGVVVNLLNPGPDNNCNTGDEVQLLTTQTDSNGLYGFTGLLRGRYCVDFTAPNGSVPTLQNQGGDDTVDSDADPFTGQTGNIDLAPGENDPTWDAGFVPVGINLEKFTRVDVSQSGGDLCDTYGKPQILTMLYTDSSVNNNMQDPSKVTITGDPAGASPVRIIASEKALGVGKLYGQAIVAVGEPFTINATLGGDSELRSETYVTIYDLNGNVLQSIRFHTSCSQPLALGDQFGAIRLTGFQDKNGQGETLPPPSTEFGDDADQPTGPTAIVGETVIWTYVATNTGSAPLADVMVMDDNGTPGDPSDDFAPAPVLDGTINVGDANQNGLLDVGEQWLFSASAAAELGQYANLGSVMGTPVASNGQPLGIPLTDTDPSHYLGVFSGEDLCATYGKPQILTMLYTGGNVNDNTQDPSKVQISGDPQFAPTVLIIASEKANGAGKVYFSGQVNLGETFVIDARLGGDTELRSETYVTIYNLNGSVLQSILFHTSCSQPLALGDQFGGIQLVGFQDKNGGGEGEIPPGAEIRADLCQTYGKPQILTMLYTGENIVDNAQDPSKVLVTGDPLFASSVFIIASEKVGGAGKVYFSGQVNLDETFVIDARLGGDSELRSETWVTIYAPDGSVLQSILFHTSCSQPLAIDDQFGGIQLVGFADKTGAGEGRLPDPGSVTADLCDTYGKPQVLTMLYTGDNVNSNTQDPSKVQIAGDPQFAAAVRILATNNSDPFNTSARVWFDGGVNLGETFTLDARNAGEPDFDSNTYVYIFDLNGNLLQSILFHTSCSQPLKIGDQFGSIQLTGFADVNGAGEGDIPDPTTMAIDLCETYEKPRVLTMLYTGNNVNDNRQDPSKVVIEGDPAGASPVRVLSSEKEFGAGKFYGEAIVAVGEEFTINAALAGDSELRSATFVTVYAGSLPLQSIEFHTSCSQPLFIGDQFGSIQLTGFVDKNGNGPQ